MAEAEAPWPTELRLRDGGGIVRITFDSGEAFELEAEYLRVESPSAEVKGHGPGEEVTVAGKRNVTIRQIEEIGNYAVRLIFSDGHSTGLYTWAYLLKLGRERESLWRSYLDRLESQGLGRE